MNPDDMKTTYTPGNWREYASKIDRLCMMTKLPMPACKCALDDYEGDFERALDNLLNNITPEIGADNRER